MESAHWMTCNGELFEVSADAGLHCADVAAGQEVPVGALSGSAVTRVPGDLLLGRVAAVRCRLAASARVA